MHDKIAVIGLGYVGLPVAIAMAKKFPGVVGFDIKDARISALRQGYDATGETPESALKETSALFSCDMRDLRDCTVFIVSVPTPIDASRQPDLGPVIAASRTIGGVLKKGDVVVYESTVYPGVTEEICGPVLAETSGMVQGVDFNLAYSPERISPADKLHTFETITKIVSGDTPDTLERIAAIYGAVITAGIHKAPSIKVAEAAKVIENTQRDLNIALMNELAIIFEKMDIRTADVIAATQTKWNALPFTPGLVGGHCISVDPYYLTAKAEQLGYHPQVILSGRRINDGMGNFIAQKLIKLLIGGGKPVNGAKVGIFGLTYKENVPDLRNSRVPDIIRELNQFSIKTFVHDALADPHEAMEEYGVPLVGLDDLPGLDAVVLAVPHRAYLERDADMVLSRLGGNGIVIDIKSVLDPQGIALQGHTLWSL